MPHRPALLILLLLLILGGVVIARSGEPVAERAYELSGRSPQGLLILTRWLGEMGYRVQTVPGPAFRLPDEAHLLFVYPVQEPFTQEEAEEAARWVAEGRTLAVVGDGSPALREVFGFGTGSATFRLTGAELTQTLPLLPSAPDPLGSRSFSRQIRPDSDEFLPVLVTAEGETLAGVRRWGEGWLWLLSPGVGLTNEHLMAQNQGHLPLALLRGVPDRGVILFDTYHLFGPDPLASREIRTLQDWLYTTSWGQATLLLLLLAGGYLLLQGWRLGPPVTPIEQIRQREAAEFVVAMAGLQRRARVTDSVARHHRQRLMQALIRRYRLPGDLALHPSGDAFIAHLQASESQLSPAYIERVRRTLAELADLPDEARLVELVAEVDALCASPEAAV